MASGDFDLTMDELRVVARYVAVAAEEVLAVSRTRIPMTLDREPPSPPRGGSLRASR